MSNLRVDGHGRSGSLLRLPRLLTSSKGLPSGGSLTEPALPVRQRPLYNNQRLKFLDRGLLVCEITQRRSLAELVCGDKLCGKRDSYGVWDIIRPRLQPHCIQMGLNSPEGQVEY